MPIVETVILSIGPSISKTILKMWLKDDEIAQDVGSGLIDLLSNKITDGLAQRRGVRQFEVIGEKVAESLLPLFEDAALEDNSKAAVALAVAQTLERARISPVLLAQQNLDPTQLAGSLLRSESSITRDLSEPETELYRRIIIAAADQIVDVASDLPHFTERTLSEILRREGSLVQITTRILETVQQIRKVSQRANNEEDAARFEEAFRLAVIRNLDKVELFGLTLTRTGSRHNLSVAYVSLLVARAPQSEPPEAEAFVLADTNASKRQSYLNDENFENDNQSFVYTEAILSQSRRLLIRGPAGSGKTTLLRWIAVNAARRSLPGPLESMNDAVPFYVPLRQFVESQLPAPEDFPGLVAPMIAGTMPNQWVHECLQSGRAVVLIDSVDEVPLSQRERVKSWLDDLCTTFERAQFVVTSRPSAIQEGWLHHEGFDDGELQPMGRNDVYTFIDHWHQAVREELQTDEEKAELHPLMTKLKQEFDDKSSIRNLATNPLLCAAICALNRDRHQNLPSDRIELYDALGAMLLERRDRERQLAVEAIDYPRISLRQKLALLQDFAYWMLRNNWSSVTIEQADEHLSLKLANMGDIAQDGTAIRKLFVERTGMLQEPIVGYIAFTHRTLQEFLAARSIAEEGDAGVLLEHAMDDLWREVIILASGVSSAKMRERILQGLIQAGDAQDTNRHTLHLIAVACLENAIDLNPSIRNAVKERLQALVPPRNMTEARAIASAGDLAIPYLRRRKQLYSNEASASIRALALISGDDAFEAIKTYHFESRVTVVKEIIRAADSFDRRRYFSEVLPLFKFEHLTLPANCPLEGLEYLNSINYLTLEQIPRDADLTPLSGLSNLEILTILNTEVVPDLTPLSRLPNLRHLYIFTRNSGNASRNNAGNFSSVSQLSALQSLNLVGEFDLEDLAPLSSLSELRELDISWLANVTDLEPLAALTKLDHLVLSNLGSVANLKPLSTLVNLKILALHEVVSVMSLDGLMGLTGLRSLELRGASNVTSLLPIASLTGLRTLQLRGFENVDDVSPLRQLTNLIGIALYGFDQVIDFSALTTIRGASAYVVWSPANTYLAEAINQVIGRLQLNVYSSGNWVTFRYGNTSYIRELEQSGFHVAPIKDQPYLPDSKGAPKVVITILDDSTIPDES